jgi:hypothetical protein
MKMKQVEVVMVVEQETKKSDVEHNMQAGVNIKLVQIRRTRRDFQPCSNHVTHGSGFT